MIPKQVLKPPSKLKEDQLSGKDLLEKYKKPQVIQFLNISDSSMHPDTTVSVDELLFQPMPVVIQFTGYDSLQTKSQVLRFRNQDTVSRKIMIIPPDSNLFQVIPCKQKKGCGAAGLYGVDNMSNYVAPGMEISYIVKFSPESKTDYSYDLNVLTEREKFIIPIRAIGGKAIIEFPDSLDFDRAPINHETGRSVLITNVGDKATKWKFMVAKSACFSAKKSEGILEPGDSEQLLFYFKPTEVKRYNEKMILSYDMLQAEVQLLGDSYKAYVYLSKDILKMKPTYVGLEYCEFVEIVNDGTDVVEFTWRACKNEKEEQDKREKRIRELDAEETSRRVILEEAQFEDSEELSLESSDSYDEDELSKRREMKTKRKKDVITRDYQSQKADVMNMTLYFNDENNSYKIEPQAGKIWPKSRMTISVKFTPQRPGETPVDAYCHVTCCEDKLRLQLLGLGLGPKGKVFPQSWALDDISINEKQSQTFKIFNQGQIPFHFTIKPSKSAFGRLFKFDITEGYLDTRPPNNEKVITAEFSSKKLGDFSERFEIQMGTSMNSLIFTCEGKVIAPPMKFEESELDFGTVPFSFEEIREVTLVNQSVIPINFDVGIPDELEKKIFLPENPPTSVSAFDSVVIKIRFAPQTEGKFFASLTIRVPEVAQDFVTLPMRGVCQRPTVKIPINEFLDFEQVYLRKAVDREIIIINTSDLKARYKAIQQDETNSNLAVYKITPPQGEIKPGEECKIIVTLEAQMRGAIAIPLYFSLSSSSMNERIIIKAEVLGPHITADVNFKEFKDVKALSYTQDKIVIHNDSEIPANFTVFMRERTSIFATEPRNGVLQPNESKELIVICHPDDMRVFEDMLYINVTEGAYCEVKLMARATGTSICIAGYEPVIQEIVNQKLPVYYIDIGTQYINHEVIKTVNVENRGRRKQVVRFERILSAKEIKEAKEKKVMKSTTTGSQFTNDGKKKEEEEEPEYIFNPEPIEEDKGIRGLLLDSRHGFVLTCKAKSKAINKETTEGFRFLSAIEGTRKENVIFIVHFKASFISPQLSFSQPKLYFKYIYEEKSKRDPIMKCLEITCESDDSEMGSSFRLNLPLPFRIKESIEKMTLAPGTKQAIQVEFDPYVIEERKSKVINANLEIIYDRDKGGSGKPTYLLPLQGELSYPNVEILPSAIDFRSVLFDTSKKEYLQMKNIRELPAKYHWEFFEEVSQVIPEETEDDQKKKKKATHPNIPLSELFDILPINGVLNPGEIETVEVTFHALIRNPPPVFARCIVEGGPEYTISLRGDSADIIVPTLDSKIDFGCVPYCDEAKDLLKIKNSGKVAFKYFVSLEEVSRPDMFKIDKQEGIIGPDSAEKIEIKFKPIIPAEIKENLLVYIAHLEPKKVLITGVGTFPFLVFATPRADKEAFTKRVEEIDANRDKSVCINESLQPLDAMQKLLLKKPESLIRSQMTVTLKPQIVELEAEIDRRDLCQNILEVKFT